MTHVAQRLPDGYGLRRKAAVGKRDRQYTSRSQDATEITKDFHQRFLVPVTAALDQSLTTEVGERSPILETLQLISRSQEIADTGGKTLIVVSDMLQNTDGFSHYLDRRSYEDFVRSAEARKSIEQFLGWTGGGKTERGFTEFERGFEVERHGTSISPAIFARRQRRLTRAEFELAAGIGERCDGYQRHFGYDADSP